MTRTRTDDTCGRCAEFSLKADPVAAKQGIGFCRPREEPHPFDDRGCPLWERARDLAGREAWIARMTAKQSATES
jgi:hypothetical protein